MNIISNFLSFMPKPIELSRWKKERTLKIYQFYIKPTVSEWMGSADLTVFKSQMWREKKRVVDTKCKSASKNQHVWQTTYHNRTIWKNSKMTDQKKVSPMKMMCLARKKMLKQKMREKTSFLNFKRFLLYANDTHQNSKNGKEKNHTHKMIVISFNSQRLDR